MALHYMSNGEMASTTESWTNPRHDVHKAMMALPTLAGLMPKIVSGYQGLLQVQRVKLDQTRAKLREKRTRADFRHDGFGRAVYYGLECNIQLAYANEDAEQARVLEGVRDELFPFGLEVVNFSYAEEAGQAQFLASRMSGSTEDVLRDIPTPTGTLLDAVRAWIAAGAELGQLEGDVAELDRPSQRGPVAEARKAWMAMVRAVRTVVGLEETIDPTIERALHQLTRTENAAMARSRNGRPVEDTEPVAETPQDGEPEPGVEPGVEPDIEPGVEPGVEPGIEPDIGAPQTGLVQAESANERASASRAKERPESAVEADADAV